MYNNHRKNTRVIRSRFLPVLPTKTGTRAGNSRNKYGTVNSRNGNKYTGTQIRDRPFPRIVPSLSVDFPALYRSWPSISYTEPSNLPSSPSLKRAARGSPPYSALYVIVNIIIPPTALYTVPPHHTWSPSQISYRAIAHACSTTIDDSIR